MQGISAREKTYSPRNIKLKGDFAMKPFVLVILVALFFALTGCVGDSPTDMDSTHVVETIIALSYTPTPIRTPDPTENMLVIILNSNLANTNQLSQALEAKYYIMKVDFLVNNLQVPEQFFIEIHCECVSNDSCCSVKRTFIMLTDAMKPNPELFSLLPPTIKTLHVSCYDHEKSMGTISVPWYLMMDYFKGITNGFQLGGEINKISTPAP